MNIKNIKNLISIKFKPKGNDLILNKIIKWCIYILIALMPLWFLPITQNALDLSKQVLMVALLTIALIAWLGKLLTQEKVRWYKGLIIVFFLVFVIVYGLATFFSPRPYDSLMGLDNHLSRALINVIYFFIFFILLVNYRENEEKEEKNVELFKFLTIFLISSAIVGVIGLIQILGKFISFNTIGTVISLGIFLAILLPLLFSLLLGRFSRPAPAPGGTRPVLGWKIFLGALFALSLIIVILINSWVLWIITAITMTIIIGFWLVRRWVIATQNMGWLAIPVIILALCLISLLFKPTIFSNLNLPIEVGLSYKQGTEIVKEVIRHSPILGSGPETFAYNYSLYKPESINQTIFWNFRFSNAPAEILSLLSEIGILGTFLFLAVIAVLLFKAARGLISRGEGPSRLIELKIGLFSSWLALMISWFFYPQNMALMFTFWLFSAFLIIVNSEKKDIKTVNLRVSSKIALITSFGFIILIIVVIGLFYLEGSRFIAEAKYKKGLDLLRNEELDLGINKVIRATIINPYEDKFYRDLAQLFLFKINQILNNPDLNQQERDNLVQVDINNAINSATRTITLNPKDVTNWIARGSVYRNLITLVNGIGAWAIESYEEALALEPTNPFIYTEIARTYVNEADFLRSQTQEEKIAEEQIADYLNKAIEAYNNAIKLKPNYSPAHFELALVYDRQGKIDEAIAKMENNRRLAPRDTGIAFQLAILYYRASQFDKAKAEFARAVALDSNFSNARYFLGLLYDEEGNKEAAIEQFENIAELNPDNNLIKQILVNLRAGRPAIESSELGPPELPEAIPLEEGQPGEL